MIIPCSVLAMIDVVLGHLVLLPGNLLICGMPRLVAVIR